MTHPLNRSNFDHCTTGACWVDYDSLLEDLKERLEKASADLWHLAFSAADSEQFERLRGKREGVRLALSYLEEYL